MGSRATVRVHLLALALANALAACDRPGPLSAAARGGLPPPPAVPGWAVSLMRQPLKTAFPASGACVGAVDGFSDRYAGARRARGWAWDPSHAQPVRRLAVVGAAGRMVGFGEGGDDRPDVPAARPEVSSRTTGWWVVAPNMERSYTVYGLDEATRSACVIGVLRA